ncbi:MAG: PIN domain-containing protein [Actinomycetota bacterium]|nr:PIN domain-containing protein [Actinomycetota bacterium]
MRQGVKLRRVGGSIAATLPKDMADCVMRGLSVCCVLACGLCAERNAVISAVNWCEVLYFARRAGAAYEAASPMGMLESLPLRVVSVDADIAGYAAAIKSEFRLGLGDCFAAALATALRAPLLTGDSDFIPLQEHGLEVIWAR